MLRWPHAHHRGLRAWLPAPPPALVDNRRHQNRHLMITSIRLRRRRADLPSHWSSTGSDDTHSNSPCQRQDRKSTRLNSSHVKISYAVFCLKKKKPGIAKPDDRRRADVRRRAGIQFQQRRQDSGLHRLVEERREQLIFFFNDPATTEIYTLSLHDALPISSRIKLRCSGGAIDRTSSIWPDRRR